VKRLGNKTFRRAGTQFEDEDEDQEHPGGEDQERLSGQWMTAPQ
jgi:hypothetical protein